MLMMKSLPVARTGIRAMFDQKMSVVARLERLPANAAAYNNRVASATISDSA
jgi:hypothetical protein